jgi:hypothetical protein
VVLQDDHSSSLDGAIKDEREIAAAATNSKQAQELGFLGSPTIRVAHGEIDPNAGEREEYVHACRIYRTEAELQRPPRRALASRRTPTSASSSSSTL